MPNIPITRKSLVLAAAIAVSVGSVTTAGAVSQRVKDACVNDYYKFCPAYAVGSTALAQCMRKVGSKLSQKCKTALADRR